LGSVYATAQTSVVVFIAGSWRLHLDRMTREAGQGSGSSERMGGYDQFSSLLFYILHIIYVVCTSVLSYYNMLYLSVLFLQSSCLYCYLFISSCSAIIHEPCLYTYFIYMIYMLHMLCVLIIHIVMDIFEIMISMIKHILYVIIIMLIYGIKIIRKMPIYLTQTSRDYDCLRTSKATTMVTSEYLRKPVSVERSLVKTKQKAQHQRP
jgi:hypothetical protein